MLKAGPAKKVTIYVAREAKFRGQSVYAAILDFLFFRKISGAMVSEGVAGFGPDHHLQTTQIVALSVNLPMKIEFTESTEVVDELLPKLHELAGTGRIEVQETTVLKAPGAAQHDVKPGTAPALKQQGKAKQMCIYIGEKDKWHGRPLHTALLESMRANDIAGATVYQGILGYGANQRIHQEKALHVSEDLPVMLSAVDTEERLRAFLPILDDMVLQGMVVLSDVEITKYTHDVSASERRKEERQ